MKINYRRFLPIDKPALEALISQTSTEIIANLTVLTEFCWVALHNKQFIGYNFLERTDSLHTTNFWLHGAVAPGWRRQGIGWTLLNRSWRDLEETINADPKLGPRNLQYTIIVNAWADAADKPRCTLLSRFGLYPHHIYHYLIIKAAQVSHRPHPPPGVRLTPWHDNDCEAAVALRNRAFVQAWGYQPTTAAALRRRFTTGRYAPAYSFSAWRGEEMVGVIHGSLLPAEMTGEVVWVAVAASERGQGVGEALMLMLMRAFKRAGVRLISVSADNYADNPQIGLYLKLGFTVQTAVIDYQRKLTVRDLKRIA